MTSEVAWILGLLCPPIVVVVASFLRMEVERLRWLAVGCASTLVALAALGLVALGLQSLDIEMPWQASPMLGRAWFHIDSLSSLLIPLTAVLWGLTVAVTPRARLDHLGLRRTALSTVATIGCFSTTSPLLLLIFSTASIAILLAGLGAQRHRHARKVAGIYLGASTLFLAVGLLVLSMADGQAGALEVLGTVLVVAGILIRSGVFPFHAWIPEIFDHGRLGPAILFSAPQLGSYMLIVLVIPQTGWAGLEVVAGLALLTAVYGSALALLQHSARRACGYLFVSQSALVMAGLASSSQEALTGALLLWISSALGFAGLARCVLVLEARRGRLDLRTYHGGYAQMPLLATSFLVMGLACTGFPGTLGFVAQEMLVMGAVEVFPVLGFCVIATGALTGLAVMRMYLSLFCGRADSSISFSLKKREAFAFVSIALILLAAGLAPAPWVSSRFRVSQQIMGPHFEAVEPHR